MPYRFPGQKVKGQGQGHIALITENGKVSKLIPAHNCFPFLPIIMKLHTQTPP